MKRLLLLGLIVVILIVGFIQLTNQQQTVTTKPKYYCKIGNTTCNELFKNCVDSIIITDYSDYSGTMVMTIDITNRNDSCHILYYVNESADSELRDSSMACDFPIINGEMNSEVEHCEGSLKDKLSVTRSGE